MGNDRISQLPDKTTFTVYVFSKNSNSITLQQIIEFSKFLFDSTLPLGIILSQFIPVTTL